MTAEREIKKTTAEYKEYAERKYRDEWIWATTEYTEYTERDARKQPQNTLNTQKRNAIEKTEEMHLGHH